MGNAGMATSGTPSGGSDVGHQMPVDFSPFGNAATNLIQSQLNESIINKNNEEARGQRIQNDMLGQDAAVHGFMNDLKVLAAQKDLDSKDLQNEMQRLSNKWFGETYDTRKQIVDEEAKQAIQRTALQDIENSIKRNEFELSKKQLAKFDEQTALEFARLRAEVASLYARAYADRKQGDLNDELKSQATELGNKYKAEAKRLCLTDDQAQRLVESEVKSAEEAAKQAAQESFANEQYDWSWWRKGANALVNPIRGIFSGGVSKTIK